MKTSRFLRERPRRTLSEPPEELLYSCSRSFANEPTDGAQSGREVCGQAQKAQAQSVLEMYSKYLFCFFELFASFFARGGLLLEPKPKAVFVVLQQVVQVLVCMCAFFIIY